MIMEFNVKWLIVFILGVFIAGWLTGILFVLPKVAQIEATNEACLWAEDRFEQIEDKLENPKCPEKKIGGILVDTPNKELKVNEPEVSDLRRVCSGFQTERAREICKDACVKEVEPPCDDCLYFVECECYADEECAEEKVETKKWVTERYVTDFDDWGSWVIDSKTGDKIMGFSYNNSVSDFVVQNQAISYASELNESGYDYKPIVLQVDGSASIGIEEDLLFHVDDGNSTLRISSSVERLGIVASLDENGNFLESHYVDGTPIMEADEEGNIKLHSISLVHEDIEPKRVLVNIGTNLVQEIEVGKSYLDCSHEGGDCSFEIAGCEKLKDIECSEGSLCLSTECKVSHVREDAKELEK